MSHVMSKSQEQELGTAIANGDQDSIDKLVLANLRYVVTVAQQYVGMGVDIEDLIGAGNLGLVEAARLYDPSYNCKFIGYADHHIRKQIRYLLNNSARDVAIPNYLQAEASKLTEVSSEVVGSTQRVQSDHELLDTLGWKGGHLRNVRATHTHSVRLDNPISEDGTDLHEVFSVGEVHDPLTAVYAEEDSRLLQELLSYLNYRQRVVVEMTYGINCEPVSGAEIARQLGISRQGVNIHLHLGLERLVGLAKRKKFMDEATKLSQA